MLARYTRLALVAMFGLTAATSVAEEAEEQGNLHGPRYVELKPSFVANFGVTNTGHLRYVKADVTLLVESTNAEYAVRYHLPALRDRMVLLLSRQDESTISSAAGRETIKAEAITEMRELLEREEGDGYVEDLMFTNFIVQR